MLVTIFKQLPAKYIIFESYPDFCDNTAAVYNYMVNNNMDMQYEPVWMLHDKKNVRKGIKYFISDGTILNKVKSLYYRTRGKVLVFCNLRLDKTFKNQKSIYLTHGSIAKNIVGKCGMSPDLDYCLVQSAYLRNVTMKGFELSKHTEMLTLGFPRNDDLVVSNAFDKNKLFHLDFIKMVVWYPTFRQHKIASERNVSSIAIPIIYNVAEAKKINEFARLNKLLLVLKPHFAQDTSYIKDANLSNIIIIDDDFLANNNIRSYQLLNLSDALITDYSSVYYDYLLTDRPIGLTWDDYDEYAQKEGFMVDMERVFAGGEKIYNSDDFCVFLKNLAEGNDVLKEERNKIKDLTNVYQDANSSKRVAEFILKLLQENDGGEK